MKNAMNFRPVGLMLLFCLIPLLAFAQSVMVKGVVKLPSKSVIVPLVVPFSKTLAPMMASVRLDDGGVLTDLKVVSRGTHYDFYYARQEGVLYVLCRNVDAGYLSTATAGGFTGTTIGI